MSYDYMNDEQSMKKLKETFRTSGERYQQNLAHLTRVIEDITNGDIVGEPADVIRAKYKDKEVQFKKIQETIADGQAYMGVKGKDFGDYLSEVHARTK